MTTKTGVIYLLKDKLQLYSPFLPSIIEFRFVPEIVRDLDIVNKSLLDNLIKVFVTNGKIPPSNLIFVLSDSAYFIKDFVLPTPPSASKTAVPQQPLNVTMENLKQASEQYIEHVPYDNVVSRTFPIKSGLRVCAANQDFYEAIKEAFERQGFTVEAVIPGLVLGNNLSAKPIMDAGMALSIVQRTGALKQFDLLTQHIFVPESEKTNDPVDEFESEDQKNKKPNTKRLIAMVGILAILIILLVIVYIQSQAPVTPQQPVQAQPPVTDVKPASTVNTAVPTVVPTIAPTAVAAQTIQTITVQIINTSQTSSVAQSIHTDLLKLPFKAVNVQTQTSVGTATTIVSFASTVPQNVRTQVLDDVKKFKTDISVQERQSATSEVSIILGN